jgi:hypothetical protein
VTRVLAWLDLHAPDVEATVRRQLAELEGMAHDRA